MTATTASANPSRTPARPALPHVLREHLEEHGFLLLQRRKLAFSTEFPLRRMPKHDARIEAHWDGLETGAPPSVSIALELLGADDPWTVTSAAMVWVALGKPDAAAVAARLAETPPEKAPSWCEAFRRLPADVALAALPARTLAALPPHALAIAIDAHAWHERLASDIAQQAARSADAGVRAALARSASVWADGPAGAHLKALLDDPDAGVRRRALWGAALRAPESGLERARRAVRGAEPDAFAVRVLGLLGGPDDHAAITAAAATDSGRPAALRALADLGTAEAVESLIRLLVLPDAELVEAVVDALEFAVGTVAREKRDLPPTPDEAHAHWEALAADLPRRATVMAGRAVPWNGDPEDEPLRWTWRAALEHPDAGPAWLRREVPDGFFTGLDAPDARPGE